MNCILIHCCSNATHRLFVYRNLSLSNNESMGSFFFNSSTFPVLPLPEFSKLASILWLQLQPSLHHASNILVSKTVRRVVTHAWPKSRPDGDIGSMALLSPYVGLHIRRYDPLAPVPPPSAAMACLNIAYAHRGDKKLELKTTYRFRSAKEFLVAAVARLKHANASASDIRGHAR